MATISNPATFRSVRTAFQTEGYGIADNLYAYRRGGGIVPDTYDFANIGNARGGSPGTMLQLSQFNGLTVPAPYLDSQTVTIGYTLVIAGDFSYAWAYHGYGSNDGVLTAGNPFGGISDGTSNIFGGASIIGVYSFDSDPNNAGNQVYVYFGVAGSQPNSGWTDITINGSGLARSAAAYLNYGSSTYWRWDDLGDYDPFPFGVETTVVTWT